MSGINQDFAGKLFGTKSCTTTPDVPPVIDAICYLVMLSVILAKII